MVGCSSGLRGTLRNNAEQAFALHSCCHPCTRQGPAPSQLAAARPTPSRPALPHRSLEALQQALDCRVGIQVVARG